MDIVLNLVEKSVFQKSFAILVTQTTLQCQCRPTENILKVLRKLLKDNFLKSVLEIITMCASLNVQHTFQQHIFMVSVKCAIQTYWNIAEFLDHRVGYLNKKSPFPLIRDLLDLHKHYILLLLFIIVRKLWEVIFLINIHIIHVG